MSSWLPGWLGSGKGSAASPEGLKATTEQVKEAAQQQGQTQAAAALLAQEAAKLLYPPQVRSVPPPVSQSVDEAAQQSIGKLPKLMTAEQALMTKHLAAIEREEMADVRALKIKHKVGVGAMTTQAGVEDMAGDFIVCDDYRRNDPQPTRLWPIIAVLAIIAAVIMAGYIAWLAFTKEPNPVTVNVPPATNTKTETTLGFTVDLIPPKKQ